MRVRRGAEEFTGDARANLERLPGRAAATRRHLWTAPDAREPRRSAAVDAALIVDALLGTGFQGAPRGAVADAIDAINGRGAPVVSVDVPSGVDASTGVVAGARGPRRVTVSFHAPSRGCGSTPARRTPGEVQVLDIGIPRGAPGAAPIGLIAPSVLAQLPRRGADSTKFTSGHVLDRGRLARAHGAPAMAARGEHARRAPGT